MVDSGWHVGWTVVFHVRNQENRTRVCVPAVWSARRQDAGFWGQWSRFLEEYICEKLKTHLSHSRIFFWIFKLILAKFFTILFVLFNVSNLFRYITNIYAHRHLTLIWQPTSRPNDVFRSVFVAHLYVGRLLPVDNVLRVSGKELNRKVG